jgi:hypothetical protein
MEGGVRSKKDRIKLERDREREEEGGRYKDYSISRKI